MSNVNRKLTNLAVAVILNGIVQNNFNRGVLQGVLDKIYEEANNNAVTVLTQDADVFDIPRLIGTSKRSKLAWLSRSIEKFHDLSFSERRKLARLGLQNMEGTVSDSQIRAASRALSMAEAKIRFILNDQINKLNSEIERETLRLNGFKEGIWITMDDDLVRPTHAAVHMQRFDLNTGIPGVGWPGLAVNCRCRTGGAR